MKNELTVWEQQNPMLAERELTESMWNALCNSVFPGSDPGSVLMAVDYCRARNLDIMLKPVHIVPMYIKGSNGQGGMRDVVMPGIGLYRIQAARAGDMAGMDEPVFGPMVTYNLGGQEITVPEWCKVTIYKDVGSNTVSYIAKEYWIENYATAGRNTDAPNSMWKKRPRGQLVKCTEAQALRKGWPEVGQMATLEEMEGRDYAPQERDITPEQGEPKSKRFQEILDKQAAEPGAEPALDPVPEQQPEPEHAPVPESRADQTQAAADTAPSDPEPVNQAAATQQQAAEPEQQPPVGGQPADENTDPNVSADLYCQLIETADTRKELDEFYKDGYNRLNQLGKYWLQNGDNGNARLCHTLKQNINAAYQERKAELLKTVS